MKHNWKDSLRERLTELRKWESISPFSRLYYEFVADELERLADDAPDVGGIAVAFEDLLAGEARYHDCLNGITGGERISFDEFHELTVRRQSSLERIAVDTGAVSVVSRQLQGIQHLIIAECYYHLRRSTDVVEQLGSAIDCGVDHHLVHFALGYNIYAMGVERYSNSSQTETIGNAAPVAFQGCCMAAVAAFEAGLTGTEFDAQIYWWIAQVMQAAGMVDAAADAREYLRTGDDGWDYDADGDELPRITKTEIREAGEVLHGKFSLADVMGYGLDDQ